MLNFTEYKKIKEVRDSSPFTAKLPLNEYIEQVKWRMSQWYGIPLEYLDEHDVYEFLAKSGESAEQ